MDKHKKKLLESDVSWLFVTLFVLMAVVGVGLKWARAALDLFGRSIEESPAVSPTSVLQEASTTSFAEEPVS